MFSTLKSAIMYAMSAIMYAMSAIMYAMSAMKKGIIGWQP